MTSKMIAVRGDIHTRLERMKRPGESFSDVISRLMEGARKDPLRHFGIGKDLPARVHDTFEEGLELSRQEGRASRETRHEELLTEGITRDRR